MPSDSTILNVLLRLTEITNDSKLSFQRKCEAILTEIASCMQVQKASLMLRSGRSSLRVVASTNKNIIGVTQKLTENTPSAWVVHHKKPLYIDSSYACEVERGRFPHYQGEAFYLVPIINNNRVIGVISLTDKVGEDRFAHEERTTVLQFAGHVITALETSRLAASLAESQAALRKKNRELERLEKLRTELFNMLIHDLKGPLSEIVAHLDLLSYMATEEASSFVETAKTACDTLQRMISNLLDIARLEEGKLQLLKEPVEPEGLVKEALARLLVSVKQKQLSFSQSFPEQELSTVMADREMLLRVLQNLLSNAIQYSPQGATIVIGCRKKEDAALEFFVQDSGPGVPEKFREAIFEKYFRLHAPKDGRSYSAGLGLAFCKMAVEAHGGEIGVRSESTAGSTFFFSIPLANHQRQRSAPSIQKKVRTKT